MEQTSEYACGEKLMSTLNADTLRLRSCAFVDPNAALPNDSVSEGGELEAAEETYGLPDVVHCCSCSAVSLASFVLLW